MMSNPKTMQNYLKFLDTYSGKQLLEEHSLKKAGIWEIRGEDSNPDMGGSHYQPKLGIVQGKLQDVIMFGCNLSGFWQWGAGGNFIFIGDEMTIPKIDEQSIEVMDSLKEEAAKLEARLKEINKQLRGE
jgi:hypothetical protein